MKSGKTIVLISILSFTSFLLSSSPSVSLFREEYSFWDPGRELEREIKGILAMIGGRDVKWAELIARGERLGHEFEEEIDLVRRDQFDEEVREGDDGDGGSQ